MEGSITDPENLVFTLEHILPMHKGTSGYTEYELGEAVIEYMMENEESENWKMGHIHSHNTMDVFFSGTDMSELEDNAPNHNFYLSLIVNNFMEFCAKVCFIAESGIAQFTAKDENGKAYEVGTSDSKRTKLIIYDCEIESPSNTITVEDSFAERVTHIIKEAKPVIPVVKHYNLHQQNQNQNSGTNSRVVGISKTRITPKNPGLLGKQNPGLDAWEDENWHNSFNGFDNPLLDEVKSVEEIEEERLERELEEFTMLVVNTGNDISDFKCLEDVIVEVYKPYNVTPNMLSNGVLKKYNEVYASYYREIEDRDKPEFYIQVLEDVIGYITQEVYTTNDDYYRPMVKSVMNGLENLLKKYKEYEPTTSK